MTRVCTICARGGSKGLKDKNLRDLLGRPLLAYSVQQAREAGVFDLIAVSSDSDRILEVAGASGADLLIKRPDELATDQAGKLPAIRHAVQAAERHIGRAFDVVVDLDATSPLRLPGDIVAAMQLLDEAGAANVITGMPARRSPYFNLVEREVDGGIVRLSKPLPSPVMRRQDAPACYDMNASIYVWRRAALMTESSLFSEGTRLYVMPEERSIDIDSELDFALVELLMRRRAAEEIGV